MNRQADIHTERDKRQTHKHIYANKNNTQNNTLGRGKNRQITIAIITECRRFEGDSVIENPKIDTENALAFEVAIFGLKITLSHENRDIR